MTSPRRLRAAPLSREERGSSGEDPGNLMFGGNQQRFRH